MITVGNLCSAKIDFGSQQGKNKELENNKLLFFYLYMPNPFHLQKKWRKNIFAPEVEWTAFNGTAS